MLKNMSNIGIDALMITSELMAAAAMTAPKGRGRDTVVCAIVSGSDKDALRDKMFEIGRATNAEFFLRDAGNVDKSPVVVLIGCRTSYFGLSNCGQCGFPTCRQTSEAGSVCVFNSVDLGIAIGSAVSVAADHRVDNRVMFSVGRAAVQMGIFPDDVRVCYGIPLSVSEKSIYFDRPTNVAAK